MIRALSDQLEAHLAERHALLDVRGFPADPASYTLKGRHGAVLVAYEGRERTDPREGVHAVTEVLFRLTTVTRSLRRRGGEEGAEELLDEVAQSVRGFEAGGFTFYPQRDRFERYKPGDSTWYYTLEAAAYREALLNL